ncbi:MAG: YbaK/EbsC family protein [Clostridiales bacterium]|uniref:YbaK/EbsC family protein n=1 Tax=Candidatus Pullilachnospira stercoravium TaxID=2840913 RepID=A0A9D1T7C7_9FIRM|nr:YbaK/EbsC family protein [Clostridiales bacterium]HIV13363.1 YbaK/EbsC family protein [Candidatus Pullilachnospira stercoravium]
MAIDKVKEYFRQFGKEQDVQEFQVSSATVELAAAALGVEGARIAKSMSFYEKEGDGCLIVVTAGDQKVDNAKFKHFFGMKAKMLKGEDVERLTGHAPGGVCPFCNPEGTRVYLDESMKRFEAVFPACGSANSAIRLTCEELEKYSGALGWVDVCKAAQ